MVVVPSPGVICASAERSVFVAFAVRGCFKCRHEHNAHDVTIARVARGCNDLLAHDRCCEQCFLRMSKNAIMST